MVGVYVSSRNKCGTCLVEEIYYRLSLNLIKAKCLQTYDFYTTHNSYYKNLLDQEDLLDSRLHIFEAEKSSCVVGDFCEACTRDFSTDIFSIDKIQYDLRYVFQIRNPLDILVSEYYSYGWIHQDTPPEQREFVRSLSVDEYCLEAAKELRQDFCRLMTTLVYKINQGSKIWVLSYEEMILDFDSWTIKVLQSLETETLTEYQLANLIYWCRQTWSENIKPPQSDQLSHIRHVTPNDHLNKLRPETISQLWTMFWPLTYFPPFSSATKYWTK